MIYFLAFLAGFLITAAYYFGHYRGYRKGICDAVEIMSEDSQELINQMPKVE